MQAKGIMDPKKIHLLDMRILHAEVISPLEFEMEQIRSYDLNKDFDMSFNLEDKIIKAEFTIDIETVSKKNTNSEEALADFSFVYIFHVENLEELAIVQDDESIDLKGGLGNAIASITYSTSRGILMTRFQGTCLADFILPVINPNDLL